MEVTALVLGFGMLARLILNMRRQNRLLLEDNAALSRNITATRTRAARLIRRVRQQRDNYGGALDELWEETKVYRLEDARREMAAREKRARLN